MKTTISAADIIAAGKTSSLTSTVLAEWAGKGTPRQLEYLYGLLLAEQASRRTARTQRLIKAAKLPALKSLDGFDWTNITFPQDYSRDQLRDLEFVANGGDLVFYGDVGTGKTHLACALVSQACSKGIPARFFTAASLVAHLRRAKQANRLDKELVVLARNKLIVIDEFGYLPVDTEGARLLFQVIADAYEKRSLVLTTNLAFSKWGSVFGDDHMAAAVIDRIVHHGRLLHFTGESYRVKHALMS
ncbi:IS21-like element helper ATPase IstB [Corynebacterium pacaense]|uniref:IS21-like element helper ATPase IstB n=1 Tax=Corynebacterium pacaense TaxID=1816684 RepID=UPI0009BB997C|nr:IS21-like element helper ATPase IstB [Corynebacterium pacaense]